MSFKQIAQLFDAPMAIVVGAVAAVLVAGQIGAMGLTAQNDSGREMHLDNTARLQRTAVINCLGVSDDDAHRACVRSQRATMGLDDPDAPTSRDAQRNVNAPAVPDTVHTASR